MAKAPRSVAGKVVAITGGGRGIGSATAAALSPGSPGRDRRHRRGPGAADRERARRRDVGLPLNVCDRAWFDAVPRRGRAPLGPLDVLINNAGIMPIGPFDRGGRRHRQAPDRHQPRRRHYRLQARSRAFIPRGRGHIVNVASIGGQGRLPRGATYCATKHAVVGLSEAIRAEVRGTEIELHVVMPVVVNTELGSGLPRTRGVQDGRARGRRQRDRRRAAAPAASTCSSRARSGGCSASRRSSRVAPTRRWPGPQGRPGAGQPRPQRSRRLRGADGRDDRGRRALRSLRPRLPKPRSSWPEVPAGRRGRRPSAEPVGDLLTDRAPASSCRKWLAPSITWSTSVPIAAAKRGRSRAAGRVGVGPQRSASVAGRSCSASSTRWPAGAPGVSGVGGISNGNARAPLWRRRWGTARRRRRSPRRAAGSCTRASDEEADRQVLGPLDEVAERHPGVGHLLVTGEQPGVEDHHPRDAVRVLDGQAQADRAAPVVHDDRGVAQIERPRAAAPRCDVAVVACTSRCRSACPSARSRPGRVRCSGSRRRARAG